ADAAARLPVRRPLPGTAARLGDGAGARAVPTPWRRAARPGAGDDRPAALVRPGLRGGPGVPVAAGHVRAGGDLDRRRRRQPDALDLVAALSGRRRLAGAAAGG